MPKKKARKSRKKELLHIKIDAPLEARKDILHSALSTVTLLKEFKHIKNIKKEKDILRKKFFEELEDIEKTFAKLRKEIPHLRSLPEIMQTKPDLSVSEEILEDESDLLRELREVEARINELKV